MRVRGIVTVLTRSYHLNPLYPPLHVTAGHPHTVGIQRPGSTARLAAPLCTEDLRESFRPSEARAWARVSERRERASLFL